MAPARIGVIVHDQTSRTGIDRRDGFINEMKAKYPDIEIIGPQYGGGGPAVGRPRQASMLSANPDLKGFFGANEGSIKGVLKRLAGLHLDQTKLTLVGYDSGQQQLDAINSGVEAGAITQNPIGIGAKCVVYAMKAIQL